MSFSERDITRKFLRNIAGYEDSSDDLLLTENSSVSESIADLGIIDTPDQPDEKQEPETGPSPEQEQKMSLFNVLLELAGLIPVYGEAFDVINAIDYLRKGMYLFAALSLISVIPVVGDIIGKGGKLAALLSKLGKTGKAIEKGARLASANKALFKKGGDWGRDFKRVLRDNERDTDAVFAVIADGVGNEEIKAGIPMMKQALEEFANSPDDNLEDMDLTAMAAALDVHSDGTDSEISDEDFADQATVTERNITKDFLKLIY